MPVEPPAPHLPDEGPSPSDRAGTANLQDSLLVARHDLDRLQRLLSGASETLMGHFCSATDGVNQLASQMPELKSSTVLQVEQHLTEAVTAMQFQDLASQLIAHTHLRLQLCTELLARELRGNDKADDLVDGLTPLRPNPVTQNEMHAGSIELF